MFPYSRKITNFDAVGRYTKLIKQPLAHRYPAERLIENILKQLGYALRCGWSHLLHQLVGVCIQELIDGFTYVNSYGLNLYKY